MEDPTRPALEDADGYREALDAYLSRAARSGDRDVLLWPDGSFIVEARLRHLIARSMLHVVLPADGDATAEAWRRALVRQLAALYLR